MTDARAEAVEVFEGAYKAGRLNGMTQPEARRFAFDTLLSPRVVPCSECGGTGHVVRSGGMWEYDNKAICNACNGSGQVSSPRLAVLMGEISPESMGVHDASGLDHLAEAEAAWVARDAMEARLVEALTDLHRLRSREEEGT